MLRRNLLVLFFFVLLPVCAVAQAVPAVRGTVETAQGVPVPGASLRIFHIESGQGWASLTDEAGGFALAGLPPGRYRLEAEQLGFTSAVIEFELPLAEGQALKMTLAVAAPPVPAPANAPSPAPDAARQQPAQPPQNQRPGGMPFPGGMDPRQMTPEQRQRLLEQMRQRMLQGQGGFQQVDPTALGEPQQQGLESLGGTPPNGLPPMDLGGMGEASSSDAFLISGTVGRGATAGGDMSFLGMAMMGMAGMAGGGSPFGGGFPGAEGGGFPGAGGPGSGLAVLIAPAGGPGGGRQPGAQRGGNQGPQGRGGQTRGAGPFGGAQGGLWGMQRIMQMAANRTRFSFYTRYGDSAFDARQYSLSGDRRDKIPTWRVQSGFTVGGPLTIPGVYDGRQKTFYFVNYDFARRRNPVDTFATVPTAEERAGNFCARGIELFDPASNLAGPRASLGCAIPAERLDPAAAGLLRFLPEPNLPGVAQNFHLQTRVPQSTDRVTARVSHILSPKLNFQAIYALNSARSESVQNLPELTGRTSVRAQSANIGLTQQWTQRLLNDTRVQWSRNRADSRNRFAFVEDVAGTLGISGISPDPRNFGVPAIGFTNFTDLSDPVPSLRRDQTLRVMNNLSLTRQKHTLRAGAEISRRQNNLLNDPVARGSFTFTGLMTSQLDAAGRPIPGTGYDFADFLLGLPQSTTVRFGSSSTYFRNWGFSAYVQDDWRVHPRFSVNAGLRYELVTPPYELFDRLANLDLNPEITAVATVLPGQTAPFSGPLPRSLIRKDPNNWGPRVGIAWRPPLKRPVTLRAGYSIFYNTSIYGQLSSSLANQPPHAVAQTRLTSESRVLTLRSGFPPEPPGTVPNTVAVDPDYRVGYAQIWNLSVETQVINNLFVELTYTGTKGTHLDLLRAPNRALPGNPFNTEDGRRIPAAQGFTYNTSGASSIYHAVQARVQRRMAGGVMLVGIYTFGKSLDNASSIGGGAPVVVQNDLDFRAERGRSSFDVRHQFRNFYIWELPFGERRRWFKSGWPARLLGNWTLNGNTTISSGTPFTARLLGSAANNSGTGANFSERPDQVAPASLPRSQRTTARWFNTEAFVLPAPGTFGNASRNTIDGPGTVQFNVSVGRFLRFGKDGQRRLDLRWETQNLFNNANFAGLGTVVGSSNYGRVLSARTMRTMELNARFSF